MKRIGQIVLIHAESSESLLNQNSPLIFHFRLNTDLTTPNKEDIFYILIWKEWYSFFLFLILILQYRGNENGIVWFWIIYLIFRKILEVCFNFRKPFPRDIKKSPFIKVYHTYFFYICKYDKRLFKQLIWLFGRKIVFERMLYFRAFL